MKLTKNKFFLIIILFFLSFMTFVSSFCPATYVRADDTTTNKFDETNVLDDLESSDGFDILKYPFNSFAEPKMSIINVVEYCYSFYTNLQDNYGLYLYIYNPHGLNIDTTNAQNMVQMAVEYNEEGSPSRYEKFNLKFCNASQGVFKNLFYKFRVVDESIDGKTFVDRVNSHERRYDISGFELLTLGNQLPEEYLVGGTYKFTGYAKGYGPDKNAESTLTCEVKDLETIELDVHPTYFRTGEYKENHRYDITSVYFAVPNRFFDDYGSLQKIKAEWYEYETTPVCVTSNDTVYDLLFPYLGINITSYSTQNPLQLYSGCRKMVSSAGHYYEYDWGYNCEKYHTDVVKESCSKISYLFPTNGEDISSYVLSSERFSKYIEEYDGGLSDSYINIPGRKISGDLFEYSLSPEREKVSFTDNDFHHKLVNFDASDSFDLLNYDDTHTGWQKFLNYLFGLVPNDVSESIKGESPIRIVTEDDMQKENLASTLLIDGSEDFLKEFKDFYNKSKKEDKTVVLFRFAQTDYVNLPVLAFDYAAGENLSGSYGNDTYILKSSVFFNFDILELTFNKDGKYTVIPVVASPIDIINDFTIPDKGYDWLKFLFYLICFILLVVLLAQTGILGYVVKIIIWVITAPFKFVGWIIKSIKTRKHNLQKKVKRKKRKKRTE